jgi:hypothetical protein
VCTRDVEFGVGEYAECDVLVCSRSYRRDPKVREIDTTWMILRWKYRSG